MATINCAMTPKFIRNLLANWQRYCRMSTLFEPAASLPDLTTVRPRLCVYIV